MFRGMISVCIPIFNYDMRETVERLSQQAVTSPVEVEIVCIDDCSDQYFRSLNRSIASMVKYVELPSNVGRARIRNLFLQYARYQYLLFLDCDSLIPDGFIEHFVALMDGNPEVVCGGRIYDSASNDLAHRLRYTYGIQCESKDANERRKHPYRSFMTNNFMVRRDVLEAVPFDESIQLYGHEDTLFGYRLMQRGVTVTHVENPVVNGDVELNEVFLDKTREGVSSLSEIYNRLGDDEEFVSQVSLLSFYEKVHRLHLDWAVLWPYRLLKNWLESGFESGHRVGMRLFAFYKLGFFIQKQHDKNV